MDAGVDVVADQTHPLDTLDASRRWLVGVPVPQFDTGRYLDYGVSAQGDHQVHHVQ
jgi:hypothetical protein